MLSVVSMHEKIPKSSYLFSVEYHFCVSYPTFFTYKSHPFNCLYLSPKIFLSPSAISPRGIPLFLSNMLPILQSFSAILSLFILLCSFLCSSSFLLYYISLTICCTCCTINVIIVTPFFLIFCVF